MAVWLKRALMETLTDWPDDLPPEWRDARGEVELGFGNADPQLELEFREPVRRGRNCPGMPVGAHMLRAFERMATRQRDGHLLSRRHLQDGQRRHGGPGRAPEGASVDRLRVADASAMPIMSSGNTNAPSIMIDEKCAGFIRGSGVIVNRDWQDFIGKIWKIEAILAQDVMIMSPARFAPVVAMVRV